MARYRAAGSRLSSVRRTYANCSVWLGATPMVRSRARLRHAPIYFSRLGSFGLRTRSDGENSYYKARVSIWIASGGAALPNGWELLFGEAIRRNCAPRAGGSQLDSYRGSEPPKARITRQILLDSSEFSLRGRDYLPKTLSSLRIRLPNLKP
jgi:hypothetical protein